MNLTSFYAKLLGLWLLIAVVGMVLNRDAFLTTMNALFADPALLFVSGAFAAVIGLSIVISHNRWSNGAAAVIVTLYGWGALLKGIVLLWLPPPAQLPYYRALHFDEYFYAYCAVALILSAYLTYAGFSGGRKTAS